MQGKIFFLVLSALFIALLSWFVLSVRNDVELANKPEWSSLQAAESKYRNNNNEEIIFVIANGSDLQFDLVGLKDQKNSSRVWMMANPLSTPKIKIMPANSLVRITNAQFLEIKNKVKLNIETEIFLRNAISQ